MANKSNKHVFTKNGRVLCKMDPDGRYNECLLAMKQVQREAMAKATVKPPGERHGAPSNYLNENGTTDSLEIATRGSIIASMVPDEIILQHSNYTARRYETALMLIDVSGFTDLCESFTKADRGSPSRLTQVLNSYIGAMVQEILTHGGDILNFSGDAILSMWKKLPSLSMQSVVHMAIDCGLSIQKNYGTYHTDVGVVLKVKVAISCGVSLFALIGDANHSHYVVLGQPVWDVKVAEYRAAAGDVITSESAWRHINAAEYTSEPFGDGKHTRVLQTAVSWKRFGHSCYNVRPVIVSALRSLWWRTLRKFMVKPVTWAVENDEPMEFLTEIRRVVVVFLNIVTKTVTDEILVGIVDTAFKSVYSTSSAAGGLLNKVSLFDKDLMFLLVFGLRGMTHGDEAQKSLLCAQALKERLVDPNIISVSIGISSGTTYCGVVGHFLRREYTVIGTAVNKAARLMTAYPNKLVCDKETFLRSKMDQDFFRLMKFIPMKGIMRPGPVYEFNKYGWPEKPSGIRQPLLGREEEMRNFILAFQKAMEQQHQPSAKYKDYVYGVVFLGPATIGKKRLVEECIYVTPNCVRIVRISLTETDKNISSLCIVSIEEGMNIDDESWRLLLVLLDTRTIFVIMTLTDPTTMTDVARQCLSSDKLLQMPITGLKHWYHSVLACQFLDVQAIPTDLEKLLQCASGGMPGWIQNFIISLVQQGDLTVETVTRSRAMAQGAVMPASSLLYTTVDPGTTTDNPISLDAYFKNLLKKFNDGAVGATYQSKSGERLPEKADEDIQLAVLAGTFDVLNIRMSVDADAMIMKTYDSLTPLEKMLLKCCSVLGLVFPRRMMEYLVDCDSQRKIAEAVKKLFSIGVLECEGGDFTQETSKVLIHRSPEIHGAAPPYCSCRGTEILSKKSENLKHHF